MEMWPDRFKAFCFDAKYRIWNPAAVRLHRTLMANQALSSDELDAINWRKRRELVRYAYLRVPFYRDRFRGIGLHPEDLKHPDDFARVPPLTRSDLKRSFDRLVSEDADPRRLRLSTTGGTTGEPVKVWFDRRFPLEALGWRTTSWWGIHPGVNCAFCMRVEPSSVSSRILYHAAWYPTRRLLQDSSRLADEEIRSFLGIYDRIRPRWLHGYVGALDHIASHVLENRLTVSSPIAVSATSSPMTSVQRTRIESAFGAPVFDQYGSCEVYWISAQCRHREFLHIANDSRHVEFVNDVGQPVPTGDLGNVAVTDLENRLFPLIRYLNGDEGRAIASGCSCGMNFPLMDKVRGRQSDFIRLPDGSRVSGDYLTTIFDRFPDAVKGFALRQRRDRSIVLKYVPNPEFSGLQKALGSVRRVLDEKTRGLVEIEFEETNRISHEKGKLRFITREPDE